MKIDPKKKTGTSKLDKEIGKAVEAPVIVLTPGEGQHKGKWFISFLGPIPVSGIGRGGDDGKKKNLGNHLFKGLMSIAVVAALAIGAIAVTKLPALIKAIEAAKDGNTESLEQLKNEAIEQIKRDELREAKERFRSSANESGSDNAAPEQVEKEFPIEKVNDTIVENQMVGKDKEVNENAKQVPLAIKKDGVEKPESKEKLLPKKPVAIKKESTYKPPKLTRWFDEPESANQVASSGGGGGEQTVPDIVPPILNSNETFRSFNEMLELTSESLFITDTETDDGTDTSTDDEPDPSSPSRLR